MNQRQKNFIRNKLIPFILREQGNGFAMETWRTKLSGKEINQYGLMLFDGVPLTKAPSCGTVCCIGGSIEVLTRLRSLRSMASLLGLSEAQTNGLFYNWDNEDSTEYGWPREFANDFSNAPTPIRKARVAVRLLREVIRTNGECLNPIEQPKWVSPHHNFHGTYAR